MASISGDITLMPVGDLFLWVANRQLSVTITMVHGQFDRRFVVRDGLVAQAASSDPREYLGQHLINFDYIDEDQLQKAFDTQQETKVPLGRVLCMVDMVTEEQLARVLLFKSRESLLEAMCWREGSFKVSTDVPQDRALDAEIPVNLLEVHSEGLARARMWEEIRRVFPTDATRCDVLVEPGASSSGFDQRLLELLRSGVSVGEASLELRAMDFQIYARLYDLYNRKLIQPRLQVVPHAGTPGIEIEISGDEESIAEAQVAAVDAAAVGAEIVSEARAATPPARDTQPVPAEESLDLGDMDLGLDDEAAIAEQMSDEDVVAELEDVGAVVEVPEPKRTIRSGGSYSVVRPEAPEEAPGVAIPSEASDPANALRLALARPPRGGGAGASHGAEG
jgi:hypothetical protein